MPRLLDVHGTTVSNDWALLDKETELEAALQHAGGKIIVPLKLWKESKRELRNSGKEVAVWLDSDEVPNALEADLQELSLVALNFPKFSDGRGFSSASILRRHYDYKGEIRAIGEVLRDQLFYMRRCGFTTFDLAEGVNLEDARKALADFADNYQSTVEQPLPLFRRRAL